MSIEIEFVQSWPQNNKICASILAGETDNC